MKISTDINGTNNARMLQTSQNAQKKSMEKLASGNKINRSADDASGLSISEKMLKQIRKWFYEAYPKYTQNRKETNNG